MARRLVIIGNGMAPAAMLEHLFESAPGAYEVTIFNAEPRLNYNRLMLSSVLSGEKTYAEIVTHHRSWYAQHGVDLHQGSEVIAIDRAAKSITARNGIVAHYDKLVVATGSLPIIVPVPGHDVAGVVTFRDIGDVERMVDAARSGGKAVVIGGGLLGLEAAAGLKSRGMQVTVLHLMPTLMERQLDSEAARLLEQAIENRGIKVVTGSNTKAILGEGAVRAVKLDDGTEIPADLVVMAVGIRPNTKLAKAAGLQVSRGIIVDDGLATSDPDILAIGECVEHRGICYGLVAPLHEMAKTAAFRLAGDATVSYAGSATSAKLKVTGINLFSAGEFATGGSRDEIVLRDVSRGIYKRLVLRDNRIVGVVMYGDAADGAWFFDLLNKGENILALRDTLIFGQSYTGVSPLRRAETASVLRQANGSGTYRASSRGAEKVADRLAFPPAIQSATSPA